MKLYQLVGRDKSQGFSPFVWRTRLALAHKGLEAELVPLRFTEIKDTLAFADSRTVPVLVDGDNVISDSWDIAVYLDEAYGERPSYFGSKEGRTSARLFALQIAQTLLVPLFKTLAFDIHSLLPEKDQQYFRSTREPRIGCTLEEANEDYKKSLKIFKGNLWPYSQFLKSEDYFCGAAPAYHDYILYSMFLWARGTSAKVLLDDNDTLCLWLKRMDQLYDGLGAQVKGIE